MYWDDHNPPHYHAVYGEHEAWIVIENYTVRSPPGRCAWCGTGIGFTKSRSMSVAWESAKANQAPGTIDPLP